MVNEKKSSSSKQELSTMRDRPQRAGQQAEHRRKYSCHCLLDRAPGPARGPASVAALGTSAGVASRLYLGRHLLEEWLRLKEHRRSQVAGAPRRRRTDSESDSEPGWLAGPPGPPQSEPESRAVGPPVEAAWAGLRLPRQRSAAAAVPRRAELVSEPASESLSLPVRPPSRTQPPRRRPITVTVTVSS